MSVSSDRPQNELLEAALDYARRGWRVFPVAARAKRPLTENGCHDATTDADQLRRWWSQRPHANVGVACGGGSGLLVLDVDPPGGEQSLEALQDRHGELPDTLTAITGKGGRHLYFRHPGGTVKNAVALADGLDVRSDGGYVVASPSVHESGRAYEWDGEGPDGEPIADPPEWLVELLCDDGGEKQRSAAGTVDAIIPPGQRNAVLTSLAGTYRHRGLTEEEIYEHLRTVHDHRCKDNPLEHPERELRQIARSVCRYEPKAAVPTKQIADELPSEVSGARAEPERDKVVLRPGGYARAVDEAEALVAARGVYRRSGELVWIDDQDGKATIQPCAPDGLRVLLSQAARWVRLKKTQGGDIEEQECDPPLDVARGVRSRGDWRHVAPLTGVTDTPVLRPDGTVLYEPGYDAPTRLYYLQPRQLRMDPPPDEPRRDDAEESLEELREPLQDFPFASQADEAVVLAAILTGFARPAFRGPTPMFLLDATTPGSGKGLLAEVICTLVSGGAPSVMTQTRDEELEKRITAVLMEGERVVLFDNVTAPLGSQSLDAVLTAEHWKGRELSRSRMVNVPNRAVWLATGNNLRVRGDLGRRCLRARLVPQVERPDQRTGFAHPKLARYLRRERGRFIRAALTILRAYVLHRRAGGSPPDETTFGSFEPWHEVVRGALVWAGAADPLATREAVREEADDESAALGALLRAWRDLFGAEAVTLRQVVGAATTSMPEADSRAEAREALSDALYELGCAQRGILDARTAGYRARKHRGRVVDGLRLAETGKSKHGKRWRVEDTTADGGGEG